MGLEALQQVMAEAGPVLELAEVMAFPDQSLFTLVFDDGEVVEIEYDEAYGRVLVSHEVADVPADSPALATLLQFSYLWQQTGGLRFGLAGSTAVLMLELPADRVDVPTLSRVLPNLREQVDYWRQLLATVPAAASAPMEPPPFAGGIRV